MAKECKQANSNVYLVNLKVQDLISLKAYALYTVQWKHLLYLVNILEISLHYRIP